jgi:hypothetical protein
MRKLQKHLFFLLATLVFLGLRMFASDPWTGAIATNDTESYVVTASAPVFSTDFFSGARPITLPLLFKTFTPAQGFDTSIRSEPSIGKMPGLYLLPGFSQIAYVQSLASVLCWWALAFVLYLKIRNRWIRGIGVVLILGSACLPEIVSWDHVMMSESLTYSFFALLLAISLVLFDEDFFVGEPSSKLKKWLSVAFLVIMFFWVNTRDTNVYFLMVSILCLFAGLLIPFIRRKFKKIPWFGVIILILMWDIYGFQQMTAKSSTRLVNPIINNLTANIFPYSTRVQFMHDKWGMPDSPDIISNKSSANYSEITKNKPFERWVQQYGLRAYMDFMITNPSWTTQMLINSISENFGYYRQPYFDPWEWKLPERIKNLTPLINWSSSDLILISLLLIVFTTAQNLKNQKNSLWIVVGIMMTLWLGAGLMYTASYLGETWGSASRHIQNVILTYRMIIMVFVPIIFDA